MQEGALRRVECWALCRGALSARPLCWRWSWGNCRPGHSEAAFPCGSAHGLLSCRLARTGAGSTEGSGQDGLLQGRAARLRWKGCPLVSGAGFSGPCWGSGSGASLETRGADGGPGQGCLLRLCPCRAPCSVLRAAGRRHLNCGVDGAQRRTSASPGHSARASSGRGSNPGCVSAELRWLV